MTKEVVDKVLDEKIEKFSKKVDSLTLLFNEILLDRKEIMEIISTMEKNNWISDTERIDAIKLKLNEVKTNG